MQTLNLRAAWIGVLATVVASQVQAVAPMDDHAFEVRLPAEMAAPIYTQPDRTEAAQLIPGWGEFVAGEGQRWLVAGYRPDLGAPATLTGPGLPLVSTYAGDDEVAEAATRFLAGKAEMLRLDPSQARVLEVLRQSNRVQVIFQQVYEGIDVLGGRAEVYLTDGKVVAFGSEFYPEVNAATWPALSAVEAQSAAVQEMPFGANVSDHFEGVPRLVVVPISLEGRLSYFLAYEVKARMESPNAYWWSYVDASDGQILSRQNNIHTLDIPVTVRSDVEEKTVGDPYLELGNPSQVVRANSTNFYTDPTGFVNLSVPNNQNYPVTSELNGRWSNVNRQDGGDASFSGTGTPGVPLNIKWSDANSQVQERDAFYHTNVVHDWVKALDPTFTGMDFVCPTNVNVPTGQGGSCDTGCNAFWNGSSINFCVASGNCANTARIADVVYHEYGHGITQFTYSPQAPPTSSGMGEGFSDIIAMNIQDDPNMGEGFTTGAPFLRTGNNLRQYPATECGGQVHCLGEVIMGAVWKTRVNLKASLGDGPGGALHDQLFRATQKTKQFSMPNFLNRMLLNDDDNADLSDGTPNYYDICDAFAQHNLICPNITKYIQFTHTALLDQSSTVTPYQVTSLVQSVNAGNVIAGSVQLFYSTDDGDNFTPVAMAPTGNANEYRGNIPAQGCGTIVTYYIFAQTDTGVTGTEPFRAPIKNVHRFMVGPATTVLNDSFESDLGWTIGAPGDAATDGIWQRTDPVGKVNPSNNEVVQPEDDHTTNPGVNCYVTDGSGGFYTNHDVDGGATTILSPTFDWSGGGGAGKVEAWLFFADPVATDDTLRFSVSNNNGTSWTDLIKVFGLEQNSWKQYRAYFSSDQVPFTNQMRFRVQVADYNSSLCEAAADDIVIKLVPCTSVDVEQEILPTRFEVAQNRPNPFRGTTEIRYALPRAESVRIEVFDAAGRLVRTVAQGAQEAGLHSSVWDGRDASGRPVGAGVYYYKVSSGAQELTRKMLLLK
ncbi:MAG: T9SS type A sorting domain-containing protein [Candidatus Eisenbacteria bacterium]|nr:T9SS type A sorting domain-containing protein [Candidatus Eisenbacteria bacterium]MCC7142367.1 T9SS type A sorting domain-containing protein [Candidatus Eisenbacteria bacterium]